MIPESFRDIIFYATFRYINHKNEFGLKIFYISRFKNKYCREKSFLTAVICNISGGGY
jgi:hypothetical protein